jgi:hypothetical protein
MHTHPTHAIPLHHSRSPSLPLSRAPNAASDPPPPHADNTHSWPAVPTYRNSSSSCVAGSKPPFLPIHSLCSTTCRGGGPATGEQCCHCSQAKSQIAGADGRLFREGGDGVRLGNRSRRAGERLHRGSPIVAPAASAASGCGWAWAWDWDWATTELLDRQLEGVGLGELVRGERPPAPQQPTRCTPSDLPSPHLPTPSLSDACMRISLVRGCVSRAPVVSH